MDSTVPSSASSQPCYSKVPNPVSLTPSPESRTPSPTNPQSRTPNPVSKSSPTHYSPSSSPQDARPVTSHFPTCWPGPSASAAGGQFVSLLHRYARAVATRCHHGVRSVVTLRGVHVVVAPLERSRGVVRLASTTERCVRSFTRSSMTDAVQLPGVWVT
jgi:hypothetical protein